MIKGKAGEKTTQRFIFNVSLLIVHCRLRDIVILTIHLYLHVSHNNNINNINNNRNCILLLQIYRCAACVLCMYTLCYLLVLYKNGGGVEVRAWGKSSQSSSICLVANERPLFKGIREGKRREKKKTGIFSRRDTYISSVQIKSSLNSRN